MPTPLSELGEFKLINHLTKAFNNKVKSTVKGIGDDAAVIDRGKDLLLVTTDMLCEGIHFDLIYTPPKHLGYKAVVVNLSDIYAMNGNPEQITVSIAASNRMSVEFLEDLYEGINLACERYGVDLVGGDTVSSQSGLVISVTAIGVADKKTVVYRDTAEENDLICVSGDLGAAYMGLQLLERERSVFQEAKGVQPDLSGNDYVLERQLKPEARKEVVDMFKSNSFIPTSMIDVSDGLSSDLLHLCTRASLGCSVYLEKLPIDTTTSILAEQFKMAPETAALNGGEDYELLFTADIKDLDKIQAMQGVHIIGHMTGKNEGCYLITPANTSIPLTSDGWDSVSGKQ